MLRGDGVPRKRGAGDGQQGSRGFDQGVPRQARVRLLRGRLPHHLRVSAGRDEQGGFGRSDEDRAAPSRISPSTTCSASTPGCARTTTRSSASTSWASFKKGVKYDAEGTGLGWATDGDHPRQGRRPAQHLQDEAPGALNNKRPLPRRGAGRRLADGPGSMEVLLVSLLNGLVYGMLLFMLASGLTLILSMMGVLNFAHASVYMLGAYFAYTISLYIGFWPALIHRPAAVRADRRGHRDVRAAARPSQRPRRRTAVHLRPGLLIEKGVQMAWGLLPVPVPRAGAAGFPAVQDLRHAISSLSRLHAADLGADVRGDLARLDPHALRPGHPGRTHASRHGFRARPQRAAYLHLCFRGRYGAGGTGRRDRRQLPGHRTLHGLHHGADRFRRGGVRRPRLADAAASSPRS